MDGTDSADIGVEGGNSGVDENAIGVEVSPAPKRRRGRPSKADIAARSVIDGISGIEEIPGSETGTGPETVSPESFVGGAAPRKKRGRPAKGTAAPEGIETTLDVRETSQQIEGLYQFLAILTQNPAFMIGNQRADLIATQLVNVSKYYPIKTDGKYLSVVKLFGALAIVNVPIMLSVAATANAKRQAKQPPAAPSTPEEIVPGMTERAPYDLSGDIKIN